MPCSNDGNDCKYNHTAFNSASVLCPKNLHGITSLSWCPLGVTPVRMVVTHCSSDQPFISPRQKGIQSMRPVNRLKATPLTMVNIKIMNQKEDYAEMNSRTFQPKPNSNINPTVKNPKAAARPVYIPTDFLFSLNTNLPVTT